ncbi:hypothetical protein BDV28DRAFT_143616 [Aspergillus coremiiformis]|uniref:Actin binding protein n=1 Tax=Aspergillus coremiiformis TaxID=138285 RepID=A0A5N6YU07_9EURO|nr:hypothetical protein BDV28DRAFT_143616 [Aspergillus coremiiformis]
MASLNLSSNGPSIVKSYQAVVDSSPPTTSLSPTYGQWAVFSVSAPLVSAFQQDTSNKESVLKVLSTGDGELADLIDEFSEGKIQFAFVKVTDPNTRLPKNVLISWCGEGVPERTKGYFTSHLSAVSKLLHGYHVQITARADGDLTAEGIIQKVGDASGAKYSSGARQPAVAVPKPSVSKPVFTPPRTGGIRSNVAADAHQPGYLKRDTDNDGWGPDAPEVTRTELEKVQPAYQPTKVNIQDLKSGKQPPAGVQIEDIIEDRSNIVKGGYQPVGKVDIAAIRRQARETGDFKDFRPEPVKGAYEPVGKVDIMAIRARTQKPSEPIAGLGKPDNTQTALGQAESLENRTFLGQSERLTSLPKPKIANMFGVNQSPAGTKPPLPSGSILKPNSGAAPIGSASRTFANEGGKTPAQLWAERKARERGQATTSILSSPGSEQPPLQTQHSGKGEWKSSYNGKTWAPVQTTHTGKSLTSNTSLQAVDSVVNDITETELQVPQQSVSALRDQFADVSLNNSASKCRSDEQSDTCHYIPLPGAPTGPTQLEAIQKPEAHQVAPSPPRQSRSPTPPTPPLREASPIRVAMPVGRGGTTDINGVGNSPPPVMPTESIRQNIPGDAKAADNTHDVARATAEDAVGSKFSANGTHALVQYDYEKAEENELELREGEYVTEIEMVDKDWWLGSNARGERGLFPSNYVDLLEDNPQISTPSDLHAHKSEADIPTSHLGSATPPGLSQANAPSAIALYDYEAAEDNELSFPEGAEITHIEFPDDDWWFGKYHNEEGLFPANYVHLGK